MQIVRVEIENFRSIRHLVLEPGPLCALVGPNNAGKSNILAALDLLLGPRFPVEASVAPEAMYMRDASRFPRIRAEFEYTDEAGYASTMQLEFGWQEHQGAKLRYWGEGERGRWASSELRRRFPLVRLGVDRSAASQRPTNRWTLLGRLLQEVNEEFIGNPALSQKFDESINHLLNEVLGAVPWFQELRQILKDESARQMQRSVNDVDVDFSLRDPWSFYRTLQLVVEECGFRSHADDVGMGLQSSLIIAIVRAYARLAHQDRAVLAIEEPELFLHPLAARQFRRLLRELAFPADGSPPLQVIYTTHSGNMLDFECFDEIALVRKEFVNSEWTTTVQQVKAEDVVASLRARGLEDSSVDGLRARLRTTFDRSRTEGVFASAVVLVEGPSEALALTVYSDMLGINLDQLNVAVIEAGGKTTLPVLHDVFTTFRIPTYVVFDGDSNLGSRKGNPAVNRQLLAAHGLPTEDFPKTFIGSRLAVWEQNFEHTLRDEVKDYAALEEDAISDLGGPGK